MQIFLLSPKQNLPFKTLINTTIFLIDYLKPSTDSFTDLRTIRHYRVYVTAINALNYTCVELFKKSFKITILQWNSIEVR